MSISSPPSRSAFFYGTLMAPQVLHRVCHGTASPSATISAITARPALLQRHRRHRVKYADYPAIVPAADDACVRGTFVTGLTDTDIARLDIFEGSDYARINVRVRLVDEDGEENGGADLVEAEAETYVWKADPAHLEDREWDFDEFRRERIKFWVGVEGSKELEEVDEAIAANKDGTGGRGANGSITLALQDAQGIGGKS